jgi:endonuclease/exonuclease/phosphatase family metal-dependent hydrolase
MGIKTVMKWATLGLGAAALAVLAACNPRPAEIASPDDSALRVGTFNVHYLILGQSEGPWSEAAFAARKAPLDAVCKAMDTDIIAFQEMESFGRGADKNINLVRDWLLSQNPDYAAGANGDASVFPITQPIFYRGDRVTLIDQGWFFFSDTPDVIYARTFNGSWPAFASWIEVEVDGKRMKVVNVHNDYASRSNRVKSSDLIAARIAPWLAADERVMVVGDFNALRIGAPLRIVADAGIDFVPVRGATYHLNRGVGLFGAIDHLGISDGITQVGDTQVLRGQFAGAYPSDHYPVVGDFVLD